jgi:hypothetical protein
MNANKNPEPKKLTTTIYDNADLDRDLSEPLHPRSEKPDLVEKVLQRGILSHLMESRAGRVAAAATAIGTMAVALNSESIGNWMVDIYHGINPNIATHVNNVEVPVNGAVEIRTQTTKTPEANGN